MWRHGWVLAQSLTTPGKSVEFEFFFNYYYYFFLGKSVSDDRFCRAYMGNH